MSQGYGAPGFNQRALSVPPDMPRATWPDTSRVRRVATDVTLNGLTVINEYWADAPYLRIRAQLGIPSAIEINAK